MGKYVPYLQGDAHRRACKAKGWLVCGPCGVVFPAQSHLLQHRGAQKHRDRLAWLRSQGPVERATSGGGGTAAAPRRLVTPGAAAAAAPRARGAPLPPPPPESQRPAPLAQLPWALLAADDEEEGGSGSSSEDEDAGEVAAEAAPEQPAEVAAAPAPLAPQAAAGPAAGAAAADQESLGDAQFECPITQVRGYFSCCGVCCLPA